MSFVAPQAAGLGLAMLLQPGTSAFIMRPACSVVGTVYPIFQSLKVIEDNRADDEDVQWLTYWATYGSLHLIEGLTDKLLGWFPFYYHAKLGFLLWLMLPKTRGAMVLYKRFLKPLYNKFGRKVDNVFENGMKQMESYVQEQQENLKKAQQMYDQAKDWLIEAAKSDGASSSK